MARLLLETKFESGAKEGTFSGYGAIFNNVDSGGDVIKQGAFAETLKTWTVKGKLPKMLLQHGGGFMGGADDMLPIGKWTSMEENAKGLKVEGELFALGTERGQYIHEGLKSGALDGLSIGYRAKEFVLGTKPGEPRRTLKSVDLFEVSVVTFPMNDRARVNAAKGICSIDTIRKFEEFLRDEGGFSHAAAKAIAAGGFKANPEPRDEDGDGENAALARLLNVLNSGRKNQCVAN